MNKVHSSCQLKFTFSVFSFYFHLYFSYFNFSFKQHFVLFLYFNIVMLECNANLNFFGHKILHSLRSYSTCTIFHRVQYAHYFRTGCEITSFFFFLTNTKHRRKYSMCISALSLKILIWFFWIAQPYSILSIKPQYFRNRLHHSVSTLTWLF